MNANIVIYAKGIVSCSVCAGSEMTTEEVENAVNAQNPTGISHGWHVNEATFHTGEPNPCICNTDPTRKHYLLSC